MVVFLYSPIVSIITFLPILAKFYSFLSSFLSARWTSVTSMGTLCAHMPGLQIRIYIFQFHVSTILYLLSKEKKLPISWYYFDLYVQRTPEKPCLNDVTEVGTWRKTIVTVAVFLVVLTLLPVWDELAEELGIGLVTTFWCIKRES